MDPALLPGSPAINAGSNEKAQEYELSKDQRGEDRIVGGTVDIGAFELQVVPAKLDFAQLPGDVAAGKAMTPPVAVQVQDEDGKPIGVSGIDVSLELASGSGTLLGTLTVSTDASGIATFRDLMFDAVGTKELRATAADLSSVTSNSFEVVPGDTNWPASNLMEKTLCSRRNDVPECILVSGGHGADGCASMYRQV